LSPDEKHYLISEIAASLQFSKEKTRQIFENEAGVVRVGSPRKGTRRYYSLRVPQSVLDRVYAKLTGKARP
jgi:hypothetical protein